MRQETTDRVREHLVLLACARAGNDHAARAELRTLLTRGPDWNCLLRIGSTHGMLPLLRRGIELSGAAAPPALAQACAANTARNLAITGELLRIIALFAEHGIDCAPFKGPALAELLFGSISMRQFCDIDVLIRPRDIAKARQLLVSRGYRGEYALSPGQESEYIRSEHAFQFRTDDFVLELHWRFGSRDQAFPLAEAEVWDRLEDFRLQGRPIRSLSKRDLLLYLCLHGAKHGWERIEWICSFARLAELIADAEWDAVLEQARGMGALRALHLGLLLAIRFCALRAPSAAAEGLTIDQGARRLAEQAQAFLFQPAATHEQREFRRHRFYLSSRERFGDRARIVFFSTARIPHPLARDWDLFRIPVRMSFLYYLLRPIRLCREYGLRLLQG